MQQRGLNPCSILGWGYKIPHAAEQLCREPHYALLTKWRHRPNPLSSFCRHGTVLKVLGLVILTWSFLSSVELTGKNVKVLIVLERNMRKHKAFYTCAEKIIDKITTDICSRIFTKNVSA